MTEMLELQPPAPEEAASPPAPARRKARTRKLTAKQQRFIAVYKKTGNASEAYREAYDAENMSREAIAIEACRLLKAPNVALVIQQATDMAAKKLELTIDGIASEIQKIAMIEKPTDDFKWAHKIDGITRAMKFLGMEKVENTAPPQNIQVEVVLVKAAGVPR